MSSASQPPSIPPPAPSNPAPPQPSNPPPPVSQPTPSDPTPSGPPPSGSPPPPPPVSSDPPPSPSPPPSQQPSGPSPSSPPPPPLSDPPPPTPSTPPPPSPSGNSPTHLIITNSGGGVITITSVIPQSAPSSSNSAIASNNNNSFFDNKGAVGGVFAVVGLVGLGIIIALITYGIRRRRAKQFDDDVAEAAREAAHARPPVFFDDPADDGDRSYGTQNYGYSDNSHGSHNQPPLDHNRDMYNMGEMHRYAAPVASAGAAGVGVMRARSRREFDDTPANPGIAGYGAGGAGAGMYNNNFGPGETTSPYPAFAGAQTYDTYPDQYGNSNRYAPQAAHYNNQYTDNLVDTGMTAAVATHRQPSQHRNQNQNLARQKSQGSRSLVDGFHSASASGPAEPMPPPPPQTESYASRYQPGYRPDPANHPMPAPARTSVYSRGGVDDDAYGGVHSPEQSAPRYSIIDDSGDESDDHHDTRRVLKVANE